MKLFYFIIVRLDSLLYNSGNRYIDGGTIMKILIVDDSRFSQITTSKFIKNEFEDIEIDFANNGEEGFLKYKELDPDYVFVDLLMPIVNGQELVRLIKGYDKDANIFVISADVQKAVKEELAGFGILAFINKPFDNDKLKLVSQIIRAESHE